MKPSGLINRIKSRSGRALGWFTRWNKTEEKSPEMGADHALVVSVTAPEKIPRYRQLRYALRVIPHNEKRVLLWATALLILSLGTGGVFWLRSHLGQRPAIGGTYTEAVIGQPKYINPFDALANDADKDLTKLIFSGLYKMDGLTTVPDIAESHELSEDGKTLTVKLRQGVRFHDGAELIASDVQYTYEAVQDAARISPLQPLYRNLKISIADDYTVVFEMDKPDALILNKLTLGIVPAHLWQEMPASAAHISDLNLKPIGSGPYKVKSFRRDSIGNIYSYSLEAFDEYYGEKPHIQTLVMQYYPDQIQALDALRSGLVEGMPFVNATDAAKNKSSGRLLDVRLELPQETVAFFNLKDSILSSKEVRTALGLAVNKQDIVDALNGSAAQVETPFPFMGMSTGTPLTQDLEKARTLLTQSGWALKEGENVRAKADKNNTASSTQFELNILTPDNPDLLKLAETLKRQWSLIGAKVSIEAVPIDEVMRRATRERSAQVVLLNLFLGADQDMFPFWWSGEISTRGLNISALSDKGVDTALENVRQASTTAALTENRDKLSQAIQNALPALFLTRPIQHYLISNKIKGVSEGYVIADPSDRFNRISDWYIKTGWGWK
ncbi:MAG: peptide ABC transporter substrate-binding protein [Patescibacteria group bacterium]|nr:peptide ABC transporter substrate-binding protein [Patescibacteria group bacterium]